MVPRKEELYNIKFDKKEVAACLADNEKTIIGLFNFSEHDKKVMLLKNKSEYEDLMTGNKIDINKTVVPGRGFYYLKEI